MTDRILDMRAQQTRANIVDCAKLVRGQPVVRRPEDVIAAMLHQTGCWFSVDKHRVRRHGGDQAAARHERGHVEAGPDGGPPAGDLSVAALLPTVPSKRRQADQRRDLAAIQVPELGQLRQQRPGRPEASRL